MATLSRVRSSPASSLNSYFRLRDRVRTTLLEGQKKIERETVLTYWQAGKYIKEYFLQNQDRADLGQKTIQRLADDLELDESNLWRMLKFARSFPVLDARPELSWAHYRTAIGVADEKQRAQLIEKAAKEKWTSRELEIEVRNRNWSKRLLESENKKPARLSQVTLGPFHTYQIIQPETIHQDERTLLLDLGFSIKKEMSLFPRVHYPAGTIVTSVKNQKGDYSLIKAKTQSPDLLYTYKAYVVSVLDGDTLKVDFRLGFGDRKGETLRLNSIDCPEINTAEGKAAKRFVESELSGCEFITVKSVKTRKEKWGRYLGDVFYQKKPTHPPLHLNQLLLDHGFAVRVRNGS